MVRFPFTSMVPEMVFVLLAVPLKTTSLKTSEPGVIVAALLLSHVTVPPLAVKVGELELDVQVPATVMVPEVEVNSPPDNI